jgi:SAM-dependent methyltransferase
VFRGLLQRYGTEDIKQRLGDWEFASGRWDCLANMAGDCLYPYVERYARQGSVLDLGCGPGTTGNELQPDSYNIYTGVDISEVAIERARARTARNHRSATNEYFRSDIFTYAPARRYDVIVLADSLYYMPARSWEVMLRRYSAYLNPRGVFVARIKGVRPEWFDSAASRRLTRRPLWRLMVGRDSPSWIRRRSILTFIESEFSVVERGLHHYREVICVIVFQPSAKP